MAKFNSETASEAGKKGAKKAAEVKRYKRETKEAIQLLLNMAAKGKISTTLEDMGYEDHDKTYINALVAKLYTMSMNGDLGALDRLMKLGGADPEENRKQAELMAKIKQQNVELQLKIKELELKMGQNTDIDAESSEDVVIYLPEVEKLADDFEKTAENSETYIEFPELEAIEDEV